MLVAVAPGTDRSVNLTRMQCHKYRICLPRVARLLQQLGCQCQGMSRLHQSRSRLWISVVEFGRDPEESTYKYANKPLSESVDNLITGRVMLPTSQATGLTIVLVRENVQTCIDCDTNCVDMRMTSRNS